MSLNMVSNSESLYKILSDCLSQVQATGIGPDGLVFPVDCADVPEGEHKIFCQNLEQIFFMLNESYRYAQSLAGGELNAEVSRNNIFAMPLKALQASLKHLTWQTRQVAAGDLSQKVSFLGDFSLSFNLMIESLREKDALEQRLKTITDTLGEGIYLVDPHGCLVFANPEAEHLLGYREEEMRGKQIFNTIHSRQEDGTIHPHVDTRFASAIRHGHAYQDDNCVFSCQSGRLMPVSVTCRPVLFDDTLQGLVIAFRDITEQKKYQQSLLTINELLEKQASIDSLTGIYNRMKFLKLLTVEITKAQRYKSPLTVIMLDVDNFKNVNDDFGHHSGDLVLRALAKVIGNSIRTSDIFARWGGEEFLVVTPNIDLNQGLQVAEKLREQLSETTFAIPRPVTASFGVSQYREGDSDTSMIHRADEALYRAKKNGRNRVEPE